jgi:hypothetical protein
MTGLADLPRYRALAAHFMRAASVACCPRAREESSLRARSPIRGHPPLYSRPPSPRLARALQFIAVESWGVCDVGSRISRRRRSDYSVGR